MLNYMGCSLAMKNIKQKLLTTGLFLNNDYLDLYCGLIKDNALEKNIRFKTQRHHIVPRTICHLLNYDFCDSKDNLVNLYYKDHLLAHYYLCLCLNNVELQYKMFMSLQFMLGSMKEHGCEELPKYKSFLHSLPEYQRLYEQSKLLQSEKAKTLMTGHKCSQATKDKISTSNGGRKYVHKDGVVRSIKPDEVSLYLELGWYLGNPNNQNRDTKKGTTIINKDGREKYVYPNELETYMLDGWAHGRSQEHRMATKTGTIAFYKKLTPEEIREKCATRTGQTWTWSKETREKISKGNLGKKHTEQTLHKLSQQKKNTIWMTNGIIDVMPKIEQKEKYEKLGFKLGRTKNRTQGGN